MTANEVTRREFLSGTAAAATMLGGVGPSLLSAVVAQTVEPSSARSRFDVIVVGLGALGSACAYHLSKRGASVLGLEQFDIGHGLGSSGGQSRQTKLSSYVNTPEEPLIRRSFELWPELERATGQQVLHLTGCLFMNPGEQGRGLAGKCRFELYDHAELARRFPQFVLPKDYTGLFDPVGGVLRPELAIACHCLMALRQGADLRAREAVKSWSEDESGVTVTSSRGKYSAKQIVFCAGPWTTKLVEPSGRTLNVTRQAMGWVWPKEPAKFELDALPTWMIGPYYGFPILPGYPGFKLALHRFGNAVEPDQVDRNPNRNDETTIRDCLRQHIPLADGALLGMKICLYTVGGRIVSRHPRMKPVIIATACEGGGFKFSGALGEAVADLVTQGKSELPIQHLAF